MDRINISPSGITTRVNKLPQAISSPSRTVPGPSSGAKSVSSEDDSVCLSKAEASLLQKVVRKGLIESKYDIEVQRKDPNSPLYSVKTFEALHL